MKAWGQGDPKIEPVRDDNFVGSVAEGGVVNFKNIFFNPHAHLTHTECCGHITKEFHSVNDSLNNYFFNAQLVTVEPKAINNDSIITLQQIHDHIYIYIYYVYIYIYISGYRYRYRYRNRYSCHKDRRTCLRLT